MPHEYDTHKFADGRALRVINDVIFVRPVDDERVTGGGLLLTADQHPYHVGEVLAFGYHTVKKTGVKVPLNTLIPDLAVGKWAYYIKYLGDQHSNVRIQEDFDGAIKIASMDIILLFDNEADAKAAIRS